MFNKFIKALNNMHRGQKGITGLETAIILIAFVTVASVLAYSVLSAGIFSAERGKAAVYSGLQSAQSTMSLKGSMTGTGDMTVPDAGFLKTVTFYLGLAINGDSVDLTQVSMKYWDSGTKVTPLVLDTDWTCTIVHDGQDDLVNTTLLSGTDLARIKVTLPSVLVASYTSFTIQINPPTGASITLQRTIGSCSAFMTLN